MPTDEIELKASILAEHGFDPAHCLLIAQAHTEGWSWYYCRGKYRIKHCKRAYALLDLWQSKKQH